MAASVLEEGVLGAGSAVVVAGAGAGSAVVVARTGAGAESAKAPEGVSGAESAKAPQVVEINTAEAKSA